MTARSQPYRIEWPLNAEQARNLDEMFQILFDDLRNGSLTVNLATQVTGTLAVTHGGTGTATAFTAGSVVFAGTSGVYTQSNSKFFWDNTNSRLGIGTAAPSFPLDIQASVDGDLRLLVQNSSVGTSAFSDILVKTGTTNAYIGSIGQNYSSFGAGRSFLEAASLPGQGWDFLADAANGDFRFYTAGYDAAHERFRVGTNVTLYNSAMLQFGGTSALFGALKAGTSQVVVRLADDSGAANITADSIIANGGGSGTAGFLCYNAGFFYWSTRSAISSPADGQVKVSNNAVSAGVLFDVTTDGTLAIRNRAGTAATGNLDVGAKVTKYNNIATAGEGVPAIYSEAITSTQTANATILTYAPPATAGRYAVSGVITTTSATNTGTVQLTLDYKDSQGTAHTADIIPLTNAAGTTATTQTGASKEFHATPWCFTIDNSATNIVVKVVVTGTVSYTGSAHIEQIA